MVGHLCLQKGPSTLLNPEGLSSRQGDLRAVEDSGARWAWFQIPALVFAGWETLAKWLCLSFPICENGGRPRPSLLGLLGRVMRF